MPFSSLPPEIITTIVQYLDADSILSLEKVIPLELSQKVYQHAFPFDGIWSSYSSELFHQRAKAKLVVFEVNASGRPIEIDDTVIQACVHQDTMYLLGKKGQIYSYPLEGYSPPKRVQARENVPDSSDADRYSKKVDNDVVDESSDPSSAVEFPIEIRPPPSASLVNFSNNLFNQPYKPTHFTQLRDSWRLHAIDDTGMLWVNNWGRWTPIYIASGGQKVDPGQIGHGDYGHICFFDGKGISKCFFRGLTAHPNGTKSGYPCLDNTLCYLEKSAIPGTEQVTKFAMVEYVLICLQKDGTLAGYDLLYETDISAEIDKVNKLGRFTDVVGADWKFGLITTNGGIALVTVRSHHLKDYRFEVSLVESLQDVTVSSLALSDDYSLVLSSTGEVYVWGTSFSGKTVEPYKLGLSQRAFGVYAGETGAVVLC